MNTCRVLVCAFVVCFVASGVFADEEYYEKDYNAEDGRRRKLLALENLIRIIDDIVPAYGKLVGSGKKKVILPTQQNVLTICGDLLRDALHEVPKKIRPEVKKLAYGLQEYDGKKDDYLVGEAKDIIREIDQGYIRDECDFDEDLKKALYVVVYVIEYFVPKYDYKYD